MVLATHSIDFLGLESPFAETGDARSFDAEPAPAGLEPAYAEEPGFEAANYQGPGLLETEQEAPSHSFENCTDAQKTLLIDTVGRALEAVRHAASFVGSAYGRPDRMSKATRQLLMRHYHTTERQHLRFILTRLMRIAQALEQGIKFKGETRCKADRKGMECGYANTTQIFGGFGQVHICFDTRAGHCNFARLASDDQETIVIHEVAHRYIGISDNAYFHEPGYAALSVKQALDNADSYAFFAVEARSTLSEAIEPPDGIASEEEADREGLALVPADEVEWARAQGFEPSDSEAMQAGVDEGHAHEMPTLEGLLEIEAGNGTSLADRLKGAAALAAGPTLRRGSRGSAVAALQRALVTLGQDIAVDGSFGANTERAVRAFQAKSGLAADGIVGLRTKAALAAALSGRPLPVPTPPAPPPGPTPTPAPHADIETLDEFVARLGTEWSRRQNGEPAPEKMRDWLRSDYQDTIEGARLRWKGKYGEDVVRRAWMISREEQMRFQTERRAGIKPLAGFAPPSRSAPLISDKRIVGSDKAPVAPIMVRLVEELRRRFSAGVDVSTYRGHGGGSFLDRGYSIDLFIRGRDQRGFYPRQSAIELLRAMNGAAAALRAQWRVIYNDFAVADAINAETGRANVIFVGSARRDKNKRVTGLNWHGPDPLILHFHLDLAPSAESPEGELQEQAADYSS